MKKLTLTSFVLLFAFCSLAQGISGGIKAGLNLANQKITFDGTSIDTKARAGLHVGGFVTWMFTEHLGLQPEALFSMQGSTFDDDFIDGKTNFNYLTVPVLVRYNVTEVVSLHAGPQFGFLLSAEFESGGDKQDVKDEFKGTDIAGAFGLGVDLPMGLGFGARYIIGFTQIAEEDVETPEVKNSAIQIYACYKLFGKK